MDLTKRADRQAWLCYAQGFGHGRDPIWYSNPQLADFLDSVGIDWEAIIEAGSA